MDECVSTSDADIKGLSGRKHTALILAACFFISFLCVTIASKTSFLYSFHDGSDINWFLTVGRGMAKGKVPYKDLFEQKGILLYMLFALNYLICGNNFYFIYVVQVFCFTAFLYLSYKIILIYKPERFALFGTAVTALVVSCCNAYSSGGGEVEEYCLPLVAYGLYVFLRYARGGDKIPLHCVALCGLYAGIIFWTKYTMLIFYAAFAVCVFIDRCIKGDVKSGFAYAGVFVCGFIAISLPGLIYLGIYDAIDDMFRVYIIDNIFSYTGSMTDTTVFGKIYASIGKILKNFILYFFVVCGTVYFIKGVKGVSRRYKIYFSVIIGSLFLLQCLFNGNIGYYHLIMGAFVPLGAAGFVYTVSAIFAVAKSLILRIKSKGSRPSVAEITESTCAKIDNFGSGAAQKIKLGANARTAVIAAVTIGVVCLLCGNCTLAMFYSKDSYSQIKLADLIVEDEEDDGAEDDDEEDEPLYLLCYKIREQGFYAACDEAPEFYYFANNNFSYESYPELYDELESYVLSGEAVYVVTEVDTWTEEQSTNLTKYEYAEDLFCYHVEYNTRIEYKEFCLLTLKA